MIFYIPITSLNFNDIFATESISPKIYYEHRLFGTSRHFSTKNAALTDGILLFKNPVDVDLDESLKLIQYPLVLKMSLSKNDIDMDNLKQLSGNIYVYLKTIYLSPMNVKVLFYSEEHLKKVIDNSLYNLETKTLRKYANNFAIIKKEDKEKNLCNEKPSVSYDITEDYIINEVKNDSFFNTIKGFYYGLLYTKPEIIYSSEYDIQIFQVLTLLNNIISKKRKFFKRINRIKDFTIKERDFNKNNTNMIRINNTKRSMTLNRKYFTSVLEEEEIGVLNIILNEIVQANMEMKQKFTFDYIKKLLVSIGMNVSKRYGENSVYKADLVYIYKRMINGQATIDSSYLKSDLMKNFFAVLLKGKDMQALESYLSAEANRKPCIAFAIAGAIIGFADLPKTFTKPIFDNAQLSMDIDFQLRNIRIMIWKYNNSKYIYCKRLFSLITILKRCDNYYNFIKKLPYIKSCIDKNIELINTGDRLNVIIHSSTDTRYVIVLYMKKYKNVASRFKKRIDTMGISKNIIKGIYPVFTYYKISNNDRQNLNPDDEKDLIKILEQINGYLTSKKKDG